MNPYKKSPLAVVAFTGNAWESPLATLRLVGPLQQPGILFLKGNQDQDTFPERVSQADLVVVQRDFPRHMQAYGQIKALAQAQGKPLVLDLDDLLLALPETHPDRISHYYADALIPLLQAILEADAITASSETLCAALRQLNPNVWLLPNCLDDRLWHLRRLRERTSVLAPVVIGYMGGDSHAPDVAMIAPMLTRLLNRYRERLLLRLYGLKPVAGLADLPNVEWLPLAEYDYTRFAAYFAAQDCDIYIAPLQNNLFNRCKSSIKFLEYSATATPGVYSRIDPYQAVVEHGVNGFLASSLEEWEEHLVCLIEDPRLRQEIGQQAQETVRAGWLLSQHVGEWLEIYTQILTHKDLPRQADLSLSNVLLPAIEQITDFHAAQLASKEQQTAALAAQIAQLERSRDVSEQHLTSLQRSRAWKLVQWMQRMRARLIPQGSRRERFLHRLMNVIGTRN